MIRIPGKPTNYIVQDMQYLPLVSFTPFVPSMSSIAVPITTYLRTYAPLKWRKQRNRTYTNMCIRTSTEHNDVDTAAKSKGLETHFLVDQGGAVPKLIRVRISVASGLYFRRHM